LDLFNNFTPSSFSVLPHPFCKPQFWDVDAPSNGFIYPNNVRFGATGARSCQEELSCTLVIALKKA